MKRISLSISFLLITFLSFGQEKYFTRKGHVSFYSETPAEKIEAHNYQVTSVLNTTTGDMDFVILIRSFEFEKALMQEHFNEDYLHSDSYPKATFKGKIKDFNKINLKKDGTYTVEVEGDMTIHGVTKKVTAPGTIEVNTGKIIAKATFPVTLKEYNVTIPKIAQGKIAEAVQVKVDMPYEPAKK